MFTTLWASIFNVFWYLINDVYTTCCLILLFLLINLGAPYLSHSFYLLLPPFLLSLFPWLSLQFLTLWYSGDYLPVVFPTTSKEIKPAHTTSFFYPSLLIIILPPILPGFTFSFFPFSVISYPSLVWRDIFGSVKGEHGEHLRAAEVRDMLVMYIKSNGLEAEAKEGLGERGEEKWTMFFTTVSFDNTLSIYFIYFILLFGSRVSLFYSVTVSLLI